MRSVRRPGRGSGLSPAWVWGGKKMWWYPRVAVVKIKRKKNLAVPQKVSMIKPKKQVETPNETTLPLLFVCFLQRKLF